MNNLRNREDCPEYGQVDISRSMTLSIPADLLDPTSLRKRLPLFQIAGQQVDLLRISSQLQFRIPQYFHNGRLQEYTDCKVSQHRLIEGWELCA